MSDSTATVPLSRATTTPPMPPGREATTRASPVRGRSHSMLGTSSSPLPSGSGRAEVNSTSPSGVNTGLPSPLALRVRRRAGSAPVGSTSHSALT